MICIRSYYRSGRVDIHPSANTEVDPKELISEEFTDQ